MPFASGKFVFNLNHSIMLSILIALLSMVHHPAQDLRKEVYEQEKAKAKEA